MKTKLTATSGATSAKFVCQQPKDRLNEDPSEHKPLMRNPRKTGTVMKPGCARAGGTFSNPVTQELVMFHESRCWLTRQMCELKAQPRTPANRRRLAELRVRANQLYREVIRWMDRHARIV